MVDCLSLTLSWPISLLLSPASSRKQIFNQGCRSNPLYKQINKHRLCLYIKYIMFINQFQEENNILHYTHVYNLLLTYLNLNLTSDI